MISVVIRGVRSEDLERLREIERAAGRQFRQLSMNGIADDEPPSIAELAAYHESGTAWVWVDQDGGEPLAYLLLETIDGEAHIAQVSVDPRSARRGVGAELIDQAEAWARTHKLSSLTLTTFRDVPWNRPYYERLGFEILSEDRLTPGLRNLRDGERLRGLDRWPRVVMTRRVR